MSHKKLSRSIAGTWWAMRQCLLVTLLAVSAVSVIEATVRFTTPQPSASGYQLQKPGDVAKGEIQGGQNRTLPVKLSAGEYAKFRVEQYGSILLVSLFDPQGKEIIQMDNPSGGHGPIIFSIIASLTGDYSIHVLSKDKWAHLASFKLIIDEIRSARTEDQSVIDAERAFAEGRKNSRNDNPAVALPQYERSLAVWKSTNDERWQALTHFAMSEAYRALGGRERPKAMKELEAALAIVSRNVAPNDWRLKAATLNDLGANFVLTSQIDRGISILKEALTLFLAHNDRRGQASSLNHLAIAYGRTGDLLLAQESIQRALPLRYAENDQAGAINLKNSLGGVFDLLGEPDNALRSLNEAWEEWQKLGEIAPSDRRRVAFLLNNLAAVSDKLGQWEKARDYYDRALTMFRNDDQGRAATLANKGELYASLGDFKKARDFYDEALSILPAEKFDSEIKASILLNFGQLSSLERDLANAVKSFEQARAAKPSQRKLADVLTNLGVAFAAQGKLHEAMEAYQQALAIQLEQRDKRGQALSLQKRGETHHALKQQSQAVEDLKSALALWESVKDVRGAASTLDALARIEREQGNFIEALKYNNASIDIVESQRTTLSSHRLKTMYFATQESYYELNIDLNMQLKKATGEDRYLVQAFETNEKARARVLLDALQEGVVGRETNQTSDPKLSRLIDHRDRLLRQLTAKGHAQI